MKKRINKNSKKQYLITAIILLIIGGFFLRSYINQLDEYPFSFGSALGYNFLGIFGLIYLFLALKKEKEPLEGELTMERNHKGLDRVGIIIMYIMSIIFIFTSLDSWIFWGYLMSHMAVLLILSVITLVLSILYHTNKITNYILIGIMGILISIIGGIFVLVGQPKTVNSTKSIEEDNLSSLEYKLRQLDTLLTKGILTKDEYDSKRQSIINNQ